MPADIEAESLVLDRSTDAAHVPGILFDDDDVVTLFSKQVSRREAGRSGAYDRNVGMVIGSTHGSSKRLCVGQPLDAFAKRHQLHPNYK
jgi:hypothetical protein